MFSGQSVCSTLLSTLSTRFSLVGTRGNESREMGKRQGKVTMISNAFCIKPEMEDHYASYHTLSTLTGWS